MDIIPVVARTLIVALAMCSFAASNASAQIIDRRDWGSGEIEQVKTELNKVLKAVNKGKNQISDDLRDTIIGNLSVLDSLPNKEEVDNWTASGACASFKANYSALQDEAFLALSALPEYASNPVFFPSDIFPDVIDQVPCNLLYPLAQVMEGTPILDGTLSDQLATATMALADVKAVSFASDLLDSDNGSVDSTGKIKLGAICEFNADNRRSIQLAKSSISGSAVLAKFVGVALEAKSTTSLKQVKGGVHGYVGAHIEVDYWGKFGKVFNGLAAFLLSVSGSVTVNTRFCDLREQNIALQQDVRTLTDNQKEIVRLLLTPQGRRSTDICLESEEECSFPINGG